MEVSLEGENGESGAASSVEDDEADPPDLEVPGGDGVRQVKVQEVEKFYW